MDSEKGGRRGEWGTFDSRGIVGVTFLTKTRSTHLHYEFKGTPCICAKVCACRHASLREDGVTEIMPLIICYSIGR